MTLGNSNLSGTGLPGANTGHGAHRTLGEDVMQSAEDAVASEGADDYAGLSRGDYVTRSGGGVQSPYTGTVSSRGAGKVDTAVGSGFFSRMESQVTRYVTRQPARAAMMAAGAGALMAVLMGRRGKGGRR